MMEKQFIRKFIKANLIGLLLLSSFQGFCQNNAFSFTLYSYDPCTMGVNKIDFFGLKKESVPFSVRDTSGVLLLSDTGIYTLSYALDLIDTSQLGKEYHFKVVGNYGDTLRLMSINSCLQATSHPDFIGYCCCENKCDGEQADYFPNGNKRIEGCFNKGVPNGNLKFYYPNGQLRQVDKYNKKGNLVKRVFYDENGKIGKSERY